MATAAVFAVHSQREIRQGLSHQGLGQPSVRGRVRRRLDARRGRQARPRGVLPYVGAYDSVRIRALLAGWPPGIHREGRQRVVGLGLWQPAASRQALREHACAAPLASTSYIRGREVRVFETGRGYYVEVPGVAGVPGPFEDHPRGQRPRAQHHRSGRRESIGRVRPSQFAWALHPKAPMTVYEGPSCAPPSREARMRA